MSEAPNRSQVDSDQINENRRRFMRNAAMTLAAAEFVTITSAVAQPGKKHDNNMSPQCRGRTDRPAQLSARLSR
jgi:hypothetical protein